MAEDYENYDCLTGIATFNRNDLRWNLKEYSYELFRKKGNL